MRICGSADLRIFKHVKCGWFCGFFLRTWRVKCGCGCNIIIWRKTLHLIYNFPYRRFGITDFSYPRPFVPNNERSLWRAFIPQERKFQELSFPRDLSFPGTFVRGERKLPGTFVPGPFRSRELSFPKNESSWELSFLGPFVPGNFRSHYPIGLVAALLCVLNYCMFDCRIF